MMVLEFHQLDLRYAEIRSGDAKKEKRLLASLAEHGQQAPVIVVRGEPEGRYILVDGYKRVRALKKLKHDSINAVLWPLGESDALLLERIMRLEPCDSALEQGMFLWLLCESFGLVPAELAKRLDRSQSWVSRRMGLSAALPDEVLSLVRDGRVCAHAAERYFVPLARAKKEDCTAFAAAVTTEKRSVRDIGELYRAFTSGNAQLKALVLKDPSVFLKAQREASKEKPKPPADLVLQELDIVAAVCRRIVRRMGEPLCMTSIDHGALGEAFGSTDAAFKKLNQTIKGVMDARSGNANSDLEAA